MFKELESPAGSMTLEQLRAEATACQRCPLWERATQTVFGEGEVGARLFIVGEQPGDQEDLQGRPFVGPAGQLLEGCLEEAEIDRSEAYITNAVKHFKWIPQGNRRLHQKPSRPEVVACRPWLEAELETVGSSVVVCLGATAAQSFLGSSFRLTQHLGKFHPIGERSLIATYHPSAVLRGPDEIVRREMRSQLVADLRLANQR